MKEEEEDEEEVVPLCWSYAKHYVNATCRVGELSCTLDHPLTNR